MRGTARAGCCGVTAREDPDAELLAVMTDILAIDHIACQESALHGLGHWQPQHPDAVAQTVGSFLAQSPDIAAPLRDYARRPRAGYVL